MPPYWQGFSVHGVISQIFPEKPSSQLQTASWFSNWQIPPCKHGPFSKQGVISQLLPENPEGQSQEYESSRLTEQVPEYKQGLSVHASVKSLISGSNSKLFNWTFEDFDSKIIYYEKFIVHELTDFRLSFLKFSVSKSQKIM